MLLVSLENPDNKKYGNEKIIFGILFLLGSVYEYWNDIRCFCSDFSSIFFFLFWHFATNGAICYPKTPQRRVADSFDLTILALKLLVFFQNFASFHQTWQQTILRPFFICRTHPHQNADKRLYQLERRLVLLPFLLPLFWNKRKVFAK